MLGLGLHTLRRRVTCAWRVFAMTMAALLRAADDAGMADTENTDEKPREFFYGGQAVIEGVMMRGQYAAAISVRHPTGAIVTKSVPLNKTLYRSRIVKIPFVRGLVMLWDALVLGTRSLMWAADVALEEEEDVDFSLEGAAGVGLVVISLAFGIGLFFVLPAAISEGVARLTGLDSKLAVDIIEGLVKLALLLGYIWAIAFMEDVKRLYGYHGAEHKTINAYEDGAELTPDVVKTYPIEHPRCGTAFLLTLVSLTVLIHIFTPRPDFLPLLFLWRIVLIFPIAGIAYETIRFTAKHLDNPLIQIMIKPNLALQHLTTREPDRRMVEVGIWSLKRVLEAETAGVELTETTVMEVVAAPEAAVAEPASGD